MTERAVFLASDLTCLETLLIAFLSSSTAAAESSGEDVFVETLSGGGGITVGTEISVTVGIEGKWLIFSLGGDFAKAGFLLLTILETESLSAKGCKEGSVTLKNGQISDPDVRSRALSLQITTGRGGASGVILTIMPCVLSMCAGQFGYVLRRWR